jgi:glycosyltransferase involved in cell wall biosynthesis
LKVEKVDLVHTHSSKAGILGRWAARMAGVPHLVHTVHGWGFFAGQFFMVRWFYQALERWAASITDRIITVSEDNKREGLEHGIGRPQQYQVIHSGIEPRQYALPAAAARGLRKKWGLAKRPCVVVLSNFKKQKSPLDVVKVAGFLKSRRPNILFLWAGDGPLMPRVQREIQERGLTGNFNLFGWKEDVGELLAVSEALLLTSLFEGLPRVALQAMASQRPVVATAVSGTPEAVRHGVTGFLHPPGDCEGMAQSLAWILDHPAQARKMGRAGREELQGTFLIGKMLQAIEKLYDELVSRKK